MDKNKNDVIHENDNCCIIFSGVLYVFLFDWAGLGDLIKVLESDAIKNTSFITKSDIIKYEIENCLINLSNEVTKILCAYPLSMITKNCGLIYYSDLVPTKYVLNQKICDIPYEKRIPIHKVEIETDPYLHIIAIKIDGPHPNADKDGWFCLGELKLKVISISLLDTILKRVAIWNLNDCYWKPAWVNKSEGSGE